MADEPKTRADAELNQEANAAAGASVAAGTSPERRAYLEGVRNALDWALGAETRPTAAGPSE